MSVPEWLKAYNQWVAEKKREVTAQEALDAKRQREAQQYDIFVNNGRRWKVHARKQCHTRHCAIHNPSDHRMRGWPMNFRPDRQLMERICSHGIGHPDPDDVAFHKMMGDNSAGVHGCCGCCVEGGDA